MRDLLRWLYDKATDWLTREGPPGPTPLCDFNQLGFELRKGDVLLVEGRSRVSEVIRVITQSPWSHSALYVGRLYDIDDPDLRLESIETALAEAEELLRIRISG